MKKVGAIVLIGLVVLPLLATPADARGWRHRGHGWGAGGFFLGLGVGTLLTAPFWYRPSYAYPVEAPVYYYPYPGSAYPTYSYPTYGYPAYSYPTYSYPTYSYPAVAPPPSSPSGSTAPTPQLGPAAPGNAEAAPPSPAPPPASAQSCQTVWVEGHYETRVMQDGQRMTIWVPAQSQQVCQ